MSQVCYNHNLDIVKFLLLTANMTIVKFDCIFLSRPSWTPHSISHMYLVVEPDFSHCREWPILDMHT